MLTVDCASLGGEWTIKLLTMLESMELKFKIGEIFNQKTRHGREVTFLVELQGNKLIITQMAKKAGERKGTLEFFDDKCIFTIEILDSDFICKRTFTRKSE